MKNALLLLLFFSVTLAWAGDIPTTISKQTIQYALKDTNNLKMDIYSLKQKGQPQPVMLFVHGGSFIHGARYDETYLSYYLKLAEAGLTVITIDYRLGMRGNDVSIFNTQHLDNAIAMAVEDLFSATNYVLKHSEELNIDTASIMLSGSSAGAITALHADYVLKNDMPLSKMLPEKFSYKAILSYAGAILSHKGTPDYKRSPSPTLFIHGSNDGFVQYNNIRLFRKGFFGSKSLAKRFKKRGFIYAFFTIEDKAHSVATSAMANNMEEILWFIKRYVCEGQQLQFDAVLKDKNESVEEKKMVLSM